MFVKGTDSGTPPDVRSQRERLYASLVASPSSPSSWLAFLRHEESVLACSTVQIEALGSRGAAVSLLRVFEWATRTIPRLGNERDDDYLEVWLGFARHQGLRNADDARDTFRTLRDCHIGEGNARLYCEWASFEHRCGHTDKALDILAKALRGGAQPATDLEQLRERISAAGPPRADLAHRTPAPDRRPGHAESVLPFPMATPATARRPLGAPAVLSFTPGILTRPALGTRRTVKGAATTTRAPELPPRVPPFQMAPLEDPVPYTAAREARTSGMPTARKDDLTVNSGSSGHSSGSDTTTLNGGATHAPRPIPTAIARTSFDVPLSTAAAAAAPEPAPCTAAKPPPPTPATAVKDSAAKAGMRRLGFTGLGGGPARRVAVPSIPETTDEDGTASAVAQGVLPGRPRPPRTSEDAMDVDLLETRSPYRPKDGGATARSRPEIDDRQSLTRTHSYRFYTRLLAPSHSQRCRPWQRPPPTSNTRT